MESATTAPALVRPQVLAILALSALLAACGGSAEGPGGAWTGSMDTLPSGQVVVHNPADPVWAEDDGWRVVEELRIGRVEGDGPDVFGRIGSMEVDASGRVWLFDSQAQELRVFSPAGQHIRTIGRRGGAPGEFAQAVRVERGPDGRMWVMDPQNNRISIFDTAGTYVDGKPALGGFIIMPWPGGFDDEGSYYAPVPQGGRDFRIGLVRYDSGFAPRDTLQPPTYDVARESFEHRSPGGGMMMAGVPYQGGLTWQLSRRGTIWALITDQYRLFELAPDGDTLRSITREFEPQPVTAADREAARENLKWFTDQGGQIDLSRIPATKPPVSSFFLDDAGHIWVARVTAPELTGRLYDVFDPEGRFLGALEMPFPLSPFPTPIVRNGELHGVTADELGVQYVVRARIEKDGGSKGGS